MFKVCTVYNVHVGHVYPAWALVVHGWTSCSSFRGKHVRAAQQTWAARLMPVSVIFFLRDTCNSDSMVSSIKEGFSHMVSTIIRFWYAKSVHHKYKAPLNLLNFIITGKIICGENPQSKGTSHIVILLHVSLFSLQHAGRQAEHVARGSWKMDRQPYPQCQTGCKDWLQTGETCCHLPLSVASVFNEWIKQPRQQWQSYNL